MWIHRFALILFLSQLAGHAAAADKTIGVFIALVDNKTQGIAPVPAGIGNGDDPERNLYWGTDEGLKGHFDRSRRWKLIEKKDKPLTRDLLRTRTYRHVDGRSTLYARAYRGSSMKQCIIDFEAAVSQGSYDMVVFVGHDGLMDFQLPMPARSPKQVRRPDCMVLACLSEGYFKPRLEKAGGRPILLTTQLMYPGSFIVDATVETWLKGGTIPQIRKCAGDAYARNQNISRKAGLGVFAALR
jgi:hypothetical protein